MLHKQIMQKIMHFIREYFYINKYLRVSAETNFNKFDMYKSTIYSSTKKLPFLFKHFF